MMAEEAMDKKDTGRPIRILQVLGRLDRGGAETMIMNLYRRMDRDAVQFDFVIHTKDRCDYSAEVERLGGKIYAMETFRAATVFQYRRQWRHFFAAHPEYRVVHGHMRSTASLYLLEAKRAGLVTIAHSHNTSSGKGAEALVKNLLQYPLRYQADYLFACSIAAGQWLYGVKVCGRSNFRLLQNGIETERFAFREAVRMAKRKELGVERKLVFLHVGRLERQKNHTFLLQVFREIHRDNAETALLLCGAGELEDDIRSRVEKEGLKNAVRFLGVREDIPEIMQASDGMIFPSLYEGLPVTLIEAQASGLPVLMSDRVTAEVALTDCIASLSLNCPPEEWASKALGMTERRRKDQCALIREKGYSVAEEAEKLQKFYETVSVQRKDGR